jgi:hypothetical protein
MEHATEEFYQQRIARLEELNTGLQTRVDAQVDHELNGRIAQLLQELENTQARLDRYQNSYNTVSSDKVSLVEGMKAWTLESLSDGTIDEYVAEQIAEIMGFELTQEFEASVTVEFNITLNARDKDSAQEVIDNIDFESIQWNDDAITSLNASVERTYF